jgi:cytochrome c5
MTDREFLKTFSGLLAGLVALTVVIFVVAQMVSGAGKVKTKTAQADSDIAARIKPVGELVVAGATVVASGAMPAANAADKGESVYNTACVSCHGTGVAGAPKTGDKAAWGPRIAKGMDKLYEVSLKGKPGTAMLPKGGQAQLADADVKASVDFMVNKAK